MTRQNKDNTYGTLDILVHVILFRLALLLKFMHRHAQEIKIFPTVTKLRSR